MLTAVSYRSLRTAIVAAAIAVAAPAAAGDRCWLALSRVSRDAAGHAGLAAKIARAERRGGRGEET